MILTQNMMKINYLRLSCLFILPLFLVFTAANAQVKRLYIANDDHTDYMWSGDETQYDSAFVKTLDFHLRKIDSTKNNPTNFQDRFNCDGSYWLKTYQKYRSTKEFDKLIAAIKSGHISSQLNSVVSTYGAQPTEAAIRGMYYAGQLERKYNLRFTMAQAMENNTVPLGLSSIWAGSGAKYSWKGIGGYGSQLTYESRAKRKNQLYHYKGLDGSSVLMKWYNYNEKITTGFGGYAECRFDMKSKNIPNELKQVINLLDHICDTISTTSKYPYNVAGAFGYGHDDLQTFVSDPFINAAKEGTNGLRSVRVSNEEDFFKDVEKTYKNLPSQSVSYGNEWDLLCASMNETTAQVRRATEKLRTAEALATIVALKHPNFADGLTNARNLAWDAFGLYWEHNWTGDGPVKNQTRGLWQEKIKTNLVSYVDSLFQLSSKTLASQLRKVDNPRFYVFNPLSWYRDDVADVAFDAEYPVKVIDVNTQKEVASQLIKKEGKTFLRIEATAIPSVGYKIYEIIKGQSTILSAAATLNEEYFSNQYYRIKLKPSGVITELFDKVANLQLVKKIDGKYLNDLGITNLDEGSPLEIENAGPVSVTLKAVSKNPVLHTVRLTLFANSKKVEIENSIDQNFKDNKSWAFSFNLDHPTTHHEELGAILTVKKESNGGNYANEIARYDWQTFNHFADLSTTNYGITVSNLDCSFFKLGQSTIDSLWDNSSQISALAGGRIDKKVEDGGVLGIHDQLGQTKFHYHFALFPHQAGFNATNSMKLSLAHQNPLATGIITGGVKADKNTSFSMLSINNPAILLWSLKPSEEGIKNGVISRFWNIENAPVKAEISFFNPIKFAWKTSHIETNESKLKLTKGRLNTSFNTQQINTYRLSIHK